MIERRRLQLFFFTFLCFCTFFSFSQSFSYHAYNVNEGLPSSQIYDLLQDEDKYIWIATDRGVARFDGYSFTNYTFDDGLLDNTVYKLYEDCFGRIWFLSYYGKLSYWQHHKIVPFKFNHLLREKPSHGQVFISSFYVLPDSSIVIGSIGCGAKTISPNGRVTPLSNPPEKNGEVFTLDERTEGAIFYSGYKGSVLAAPCGIDLKEKGMGYYKERWFKTGYKNPFYLCRKNKSRFFSVLGKILELKGSKILDSCSLPDNLISVFEDSDSCLWTGTLGGGVKRYAPNHGVNSGSWKEFFPEYQISKVMEDYEHGLWFATLHNGIMYVPSGYIEHLFNELHPELKENNVSMTSDGMSSIFVGTDKGTIKVISGTKESERKDIVVSANKDMFNTLYYDSVQGRLIAFGYKGKYIAWPMKIQEIMKGVPVPLCVQKGNNGLYYAGYPFGIFVRKSFEGEEPRVNIHGYGWTKIRVCAICFDASGKLWAGSPDGLFYLEKDSLAKKAIPGLDCRITSIVRMGTTMYIGTVGKGVITFDGTMKTGEYTVSSGLASDIVNSIEIQDDSTIWIATTKGVCRLDAKRKKINAVLNRNNGLYTNEVMDIEIVNGMVYLLTHEAITCFDPKKIAPNMVRPRVYITDCVSDSINYRNENSPEFEYNKNYISFRYVGLSYRSLGKVKYKYRLSGYKNSWQLSESNSILFPYLPAGDYTFEVYAINEDGMESEVPARFSFIIQNPFWKRGWFILSCSLIGLLIIVWVFVLSSRRLHEKKDMVLQLTEMRQKALSMQMNPHFIFNSLNSIQSFVLTEEPYKATKYLAKFSKLMRTSLNNLKSDFVPVRDEIRLIELYLELEQMRFPHNFTFSLLIDENVPHHLRIPPMLIQPLVENSIKHGIDKNNSCGEVTVRLYMQSSLLFCKVDDNGKGIKASLGGKEVQNKEISTGIATTIQRLKLFCEKYRFKFLFEITDKASLNRNETGTSILFIIPYIV